MATRTDTPDTPETPRVGRTARSIRLRRVLLTTAAAAMLVVPTACGYAAAADRISTGGSGHGAHAAAPVADQQDQEDQQDAAGADTEEAAATSTEDAPADAQQQGRGGQNRADQADANARNGQDNGQGKGNANGNGQAAQGGGQADQAADQAAGGEKINGLDVLARDCSKSNLPPHDGFQKGDRCVSTAFGEVGDANQNPSLLITKFPEQVQANQPFSIDVTTRNLKRDRFLGAAAGGYYLESSLLDDNGIQRGHFHTACRMISLDEAPAPGDKPAFFVATQDNKGGAGESTVSIDVTGLPKGTAQCSSWAGDGSHRIPMMERADQTPAFDSVRIRVV